MRDEWYGDNRDLVKWGALIHIAQRDQLSAILHLALYRPRDEWPTVNSSRGRSEVPPEVIRHFRNIDNIQRLAKPSGIRIEVFKTRFRNRSLYFQRAGRWVESFADDSLVVFVDPDTGVAPEVAGLEHVTAPDLQVVFAAMKPNDVLVCYQHARRQKDWRGDRRRAFSRALGVTSQDVEVFDSELAKDVVLFSARKGQG